MRFLGILGLSVASLLGACGDDKAGVIVNDDISWHIGTCNAVSGCGLYAAHIQEQVDQNFKVNCSKTKTGGYSISVTDPGFAGDGIEPARPPSTIVVENADPASQTCNVTVREATDYTFAPETWLGQCPSSGSGCTFTGGPADGWDFVGMLQCDAMTKRGTNLTYKLGSGNDSSSPIKLAVDNCK